jgi:phospholipid transport system transporter-binding protein
VSARSRKTAAGAAIAEATVAGDGLLAVRGVLSFDTVPEVYAQSAAWVQKGQGEITIDLKNVERADSAGLALLVEWLQLARRRNRELRFTNVSEQVRALVRVNGLGQALSIDERD